MNGNNNTMSQKSLLIAFLAFFTVSSLVLFWQNDREMDPDQGKNWWTLSFTLPKESESLSFIVENHSDQSSFQYEIMVGKMVIARESFTAKPGEKTIITPPSITEQLERVKITVTTGTEKKEIYR